MALTDDEQLAITVSLRHINTIQAEVLAPLSGLLDGVERLLVARRNGADTPEAAVEASGINIDEIQKQLATFNSAWQSGRGNLFERLQTALEIVFAFPPTDG